MFIFLMMILVWLFCLLRKYKKNDIEPTAKNYWKNMNLHQKYSKKIQTYLKMKKDQEKCIEKKRSSQRKGTLRNRNPDYYYATDQDIAYANFLLENIEKKIENSYKWSNYYYAKTVAITQEMNRRGMWGLS